MGSVSIRSRAYNLETVLAREFLITLRLAFLAHLAGQDAGRFPLVVSISAGRLLGQRRRGIRSLALLFVHLGSSVVAPSRPNMGLAYRSAAQRSRYRVQLGMVGRVREYTIVQARARPKVKKSVN
jgi:hypothetical protein